MSSDVIPWQQHANGTVMLNLGGEVVAENTGRSKRTNLKLYVPDGMSIRIGRENPGGNLVPASDIYTAVAVGETACLLKIRLRVWPNVVTAEAATKSAPGKTPDSNETYLFSRQFLPNNEKFWVSVKIGSDIIRLADEITAVASEPGTKCLVDMVIKILASRPIPPEPVVDDFEV